MGDGRNQRYTMVNLSLVPVVPEQTPFRLTRDVWKVQIEHFAKCFLDLEPNAILDTAFWLGDPDPETPLLGPEHMSPVKVAFSRAGATAAFADIRRDDDTPAAVSLYLPNLDAKDDAIAICWARQAHPQIPEEVFQQVRRSRREQSPNAINIAFDHAAHDNVTVRAVSQMMGMAMARLLGTLKDR